MLKRLLLFACVALMIALVSCEGKQGEVGPKGDPGAQGPAGPAGPAGEDGEDGAGSSALILATGADTTDEEGGYIAGFTELPAEQEAALNSSVVLVYVKSQNVWWPLPGLVGFANSRFSSYTFVHGVDQGTFFVQVIPTDWSEQQETPPTRIFQDMRIVIVPGEILEGRLSAEVDLKNYEKTIAALGLTDAQAKPARQLKVKLKNSKVLGR